MWLLAGLGNPGASYAQHRHNAGFMALDVIASAHGFPPYTQKFSAHLADGRVGAERVLLLKPQTFMNLSGQSVGEAMRFYKIPVERLIVFHDELDLPLGKIRVKRGGGNGGHNGLKSIDAHVGGGAQRLASDASAACGAPSVEGAERNGYLRVRLGIGHPGDKNLVSPYVLANFTKEEAPVMAATLNAVAQHVGLLLAGDEAGFMNKVTLTTS